MAPYIDPEPPKSVTIIPKESQSIELGKAKDENLIQPLEIEVELGSAAQFASYLERQQVILFEAMNLIEAFKNRGEHTILVTVKENTGLPSALKTIYPISVEVKVPTLAEAVEMLEESGNLEKLEEIGKREII